MTQLPTIAIVAPRYAPSIGGVERHVEMLARGLAERGFKCEVLVTDPTGDLPPAERREGVIVRRFPTLGGNNVYFLSPSLGRWLSENSSRFGLIHAHSFHAAISLQAALVSHRAGLPLVFTPHYHGGGHGALAASMHILHRSVGLWMMRHANVVLCNSLAEESLIRRHFGTGIRTVVARPGVAPAFMGIVPDRTTKLVSVVAGGRLESYKQTRKIIAAVAGLPISYHLTVVGEGRERPELERLVDRESLRDRVVFTGQISDADLAQLYGMAAVLVSMSRKEAFGLSVVEAASAGARVVVSDIPAHREVVGLLGSGVGMLVPLTSEPNQIARAIVAAAERVEPDGRWVPPSWDDTIDAVLGAYVRATRGRASHGRSRSRGIESVLTQADKDPPGVSG
jgi:glycosyltransferase involved in cell wall biosynthesis